MQLIIDGAGLWYKLSDMRLPAAENKISISLSADQEEVGRRPGAQQDRSLQLPSLMVPRNYLK